MARPRSRGRPVPRHCGGRRRRRLGTEREREDVGNGGADPQAPGVQQARAPSVGAAPASGNDWERLQAAALQAVGAATDLDALEAVRVRYLGRNGEITAALRAVGRLPAEERRDVGAAGNRVRAAVAAALAAKEAALGQAQLEARLAAEGIDVTLPGRRPTQGHPHPLSTTREELERIFASLGFSVVEGPEVESEWFNFEALNMPPGHPARDSHDSFYLMEEPLDAAQGAGTEGRLLLRTHTSPVQIRHMLARAGALPVRVVCPGRVYRRDDDATHSPMFHQLEGILVDRGVGMAHLKGVLAEAARRLFGPDTRVRMRPSYFPFTEPSAEVDVSCVFCGGSGCPTCKGSGWIEILGAGLVHPAVLAAGGYDPEAVSGFAFGIGIDRCAMLRCGIEQMRLLFEGDLRFLDQF
jgi:phenylalanyl-tRNA synthetase alpha chain